jgi:uncharacterized membrane protein YdjX (TVP38/TMEM64 family)
MLRSGAAQPTRVSKRALGVLQRILPQPLAGFHRAARFGLLCLLIIAAVGAWRWRPLLDPISLTAVLARYPAMPIGFLAVHIAASLLFIPRMPLAIVAGLLFGSCWGIVWATLGSLAGAVAGFLLARYVNAGLIDPGRLSLIGAQVDQGGWRGVTILRLIPVVPHSLANYGLGLTRLPLGAYAFGSLLGQLPMTIAYVNVGAAGEILMLGRAGWIMPTLIGSGMLAVSLLIPAIVRRQLCAAASSARGNGPPVAQSRSSTV